MFSNRRADALNSFSIARIIFRRFFSRTAALLAEEIGFGVFCRRKVGVRALGLPTFRVRLAFGATNAEVVPVAELTVLLLEAVTLAALPMTAGANATPLRENIFRSIFCGRGVSSTILAIQQNCKN